MRPYTPTAEQIPPTARLLGALVWTVVAAVAISLAVALALLVHLGHVQDQTAAEASEHQYRGLRSLLARQLGSHVRDYTNWDEAIERLAASYDAEWWDNNAGSYAGEAFGLSFSLAVDGTDRPRFVTTPEQTQADLPAAALTPSLRALLAEARARLPSGAADEAVATGIVEFEGGLHLAAAVLFLPESEEVVNPDPRALLVFAQSLDGVLAEMGAIMGSPDLRLLEGAPTGGTAVPLLLADGSSVGVVAWTPSRPGRSVTAGIIPLLSVAFLFIAALVAFFAFRARRLALETPCRRRRSAGPRDPQSVHSGGGG